MSFLPKRVKDLPPLESDSEDEMEAQGQVGILNKGSRKFTKTMNPKPWPRTPISSGEPYSDEEECQQDKFNCAILNESFIINTSRSESEYGSPEHKIIPLTPNASSRKEVLGLQGLNISPISQKKPEKEIGSLKKEYMTKPITQISHEDRIVSCDNYKNVNETPCKDVETGFKTPQLRFKMYSSTHNQSSNPNRSALREFNSQKVLFQTPMAVRRAPISSMNNSITLSLCDTINDTTNSVPASRNDSQSTFLSDSQENALLQKSLDNAFETNGMQSSGISEKKTVQINGTDYTILSVLGKGGSCLVYSARRKDSPLEFALKVVSLKGDPSIVEGYLNETKLLARLQNNPYIIGLHEYEILKPKCKLFVVLEKGDMDLQQILNIQTENIPLYSVAKYWYEMLQSVNYIHHHGVIHSDLKPANFLMVNGRLKLIDFGIACNIESDSTSVVKYCQAGTFNYISPEALTDASENGEGVPRVKISTKSDVWSLGCILYVMLYKKTPFGHIKNVFAKAQAICNSTNQIHYAPLPDYYPVMLLKMMQSCLQRAPKQRPSCEDLLQYPFHMIVPPDILKFDTGTVCGIK